MNKADLSSRFCLNSVLAIALDITLIAWAAFCDGGAGDRPRGEIVVQINAFRAVFRSAKIAAMADFSKVNR
jgi:hypothetical protein